MKTIFLGTNGWYDTKTGNTSCTLIEAKTAYLILDAGNGFYKIDRYIKTDKPIYIFLSHFHLDHIIGFHILNKFDFPQGIKVFGPNGLRKCFSALISRAYSMPLERLRTKVRLQEINKNTKFPVDIEFRELKHSTKCYGYRFNVNSRVISYCTDTSLCRNLFLLAKDADLLISECSYKSGQKDYSWPHLNPEDAGIVARDSGVRKLALTHFDAALYLTLKERKAAELAARKVFKNAFSAVDGQEVMV